MLEMNGWTHGCDLESVVHVDFWGSSGAAESRVEDAQNRSD
jgi:hypothetical protein